MVFADVENGGEEKVRECVRRIAGSVRFLGGQTCFANGRVLVEEGFEGRFMRMFREVFLVVGGEEEDGGGGGGLEPLADVVQFERVRAYVTQGREDGGTVVGGERIGDKVCTLCLCDHLPRVVPCLHLPGSPQGPSRFISRFPIFWGCRNVGSNAGKQPHPREWYPPRSPLTDRIATAKPKK